MLANKTTITYRYSESHNYWYGSLGVHKINATDTVAVFCSGRCAPEQIAEEKHYLKFSMCETEDIPMLLWDFLLKQKTVAFVYLEKAMPPSKF